jgi:hypothetical protein
MAHNDTAAGRALSTESLNLFVAAWTDLDPDGLEVLPVNNLPELLSRLPPPLGVSCLHAGLRTSLHRMRENESLVESLASKGTERLNPAEISMDVMASSRPSLRRVLTRL